MIKINKNWNLNKEIYSIAGFEDNYISLIVTVYQESQFHIVFNERKYFADSQENNHLKKLIKKGKILDNLVKKAQKELNYKIKEVSYNLPIEDTKIIPNSYYYKFPKPTLFTPQILREINDNFLINYEKDHNYQNFLFRINEYVLLDQKEILLKPPYNQIISSIKISGYLYQAKWKQLYEYLQIFKTAKIQQFKPILLPYAIHVNLNFLEKTKNSVLVWWNEKNCQIFVFTNKIFSKYLNLNKGIKELLQKINNELNYDSEEVKNYLYNLFSLSDEKILNKFELFTNLEKKELQKVHKDAVQIIDNFIKTTVTEIEFIVKEKWKLINQENTIFVLGRINQISGIETYLNKIETNYIWKVHDNNFIGLKDSDDLFLIGNAYCQHLQKKLLYNQKQTKENKPQ